MGVGTGGCVGGGCGLLRLAIKVAAILAFSTDIGVHGFISSHGNSRSVRLNPFACTI